MPKKKKKVKTLQALLSVVSHTLKSEVELPFQAFVGNLINESTVFPYFVPNFSMEALSFRLVPMRTLPEAVSAVR